jgi:hypothetical protein
MAKVIPILPCVTIDAQCDFYESLGFRVIEKYRAPNAYAVVGYEDIILHFWGSRKHEPSSNACMVFVELDDVDQVNSSFCVNLKEALGRVPRTGMPRISKVRELKDDNRFTVCDPAGNTLYFGTPNGGNTVEGRTLDCKQHAKDFARIYDLLHSHESPEQAAKALVRFQRERGSLDQADMQKLEELAAEIESSLQTSP